MNTAALRIVGLITRLITLSAILPMPSSNGQFSGKLTKPATRPLFHVSSDMVLKSTAEVYSWHRESHIDQYIKLLADPDAPTRAKAAWFLSRFQGQEAASALLGAALTETDLTVLNEITDGVRAGLFLNVQEPTPDSQSVEVIREHLRVIREDYQRSGHGKIIRRSFTNISKGGELAIKFFVEASAERFDPEVLKILAEIASGSSSEAIVSRSRDLLLVATGFDARALDRNSLLAALEGPGAMEPTKVFERLSKFAKGKGFNWASDNIAGSTVWLYRTKDPVYQAIAFRLTLWYAESRKIEK